MTVNILRPSKFVNRYYAFKHETFCGPFQYSVAAENVVVETFSGLKLVVTKYTANHGNYIYSDK